MNLNRLGAVLLAVGLLFSLSIPVLADSELCPPLDSGKIDVSGDPPTVEFEAPDGFLITRYCVKAGTSYVLVIVDPPAASVTIDHPVKDSVSHYSVGWTQTTTTTTLDTTSTTSRQEETTTTSDTTTTTEGRSSTTTTLGQPTTTTGSPSTTAEGNTPTTTGPAPTTSAPISSSTTGAGTELERLPFTGTGDTARAVIFGVGLVALGSLFAFGFRKEEE